jgi:glycerophosphoryl diester phosphodiesterase
MTLVYAHRGASAEFPENTLQAFVRALDVGADVLETDAHVTRDGEVVLSHDEVGTRMANVPRAIVDCTLEEVRAWDVGWGFRDKSGARCFAGKGFVVPTLRELLAELKTARFNIDCKARDHASVDRILDVIRRAGAEERVQLSSFHSSNLRYVRKQGWRGGTGLGQSEAIRLLLTPTRVLKLLPLKGQIAQIPPGFGPIRIDTKRFIDRCHALGLRVDYWVIDDPREAQRLVQLGADGVMTDDPATIVPAVREVSR